MILYTIIAYQGLQPALLTVDMPTQYRHQWLSIGTLIQGYKIISAL